MHKIPLTGFGKILASGISFSPFEISVQTETTIVSLTAFEQPVRASVYEYVSVNIPVPADDGLKFPELIPAPKKFPPDG